MSLCTVGKSAIRCLLIGLSLDDAIILELGFVNMEVADLSEDGAGIDGVFGVLLIRGRLVALDGDSGIGFFGLRLPPFLVEEFP